MPPRTGPLVRSDLAHLARVVRTAQRRADVVVVLPHWGTQYTHRPEPVQRRVARRLVAAGADLVVGGHPHWVQGVDLVDGVPVAHSLGNFVFDMDFMEQTLEGVVLVTTWRGADLESLRLVPYRMDPVAFAPRRLRGDAAAERARRRPLHEHRSVPRPRGPVGQSEVEVTHRPSTSATACFCIGLVRKSSMPAARHRSRSPSVTPAVRAITGVRRPPSSRRRSSSVVW